jgi:hypothetical protein
LPNQPSLGRHDDSRDAFSGTSRGDVENASSCKTAGGYRPPEYLPDPLQTSSSEPTVTSSLVGGTHDDGITDVGGEGDEDEKSRRVTGRSQKSGGRGGKLRKLRKSMARTTGAHGFFGRLTGRQHGQSAGYAGGSGDPAGMQQDSKASDEQVRPEHAQADAETGQQRGWASPSHQDVQSEEGSSESACAAGVRAALEHRGGESTTAGDRGGRQELRAHVTDSGTEDDPPGPRSLLGVDAALLLHIILTVTAWAGLTAVAAFLTFKNALMLMSYAGGFGASLLAFVVPAACYFRLAPLSSDFTALPQCACFGRPILPNQSAMFFVLLLGITGFVLRCYSTTICFIGGDDGQRDEHDGHRGSLLCHFTDNAVVSIATSGFDPGGGDDDDTGCVVGR